MRKKRVKDRLGRYQNIGTVLAEDVFGGSRQYVVDFSEEGIKKVKENELDLVEDPLDRLYKGDQSLKELQLRLRASMMFNDNLRTGSLSRQKIDVLPHQLLMADRATTTKARGFLIADDVGLGKTIEAGLVIRSMMARGLANRILIICPANLTIQWREQMLDRFDEYFDILGEEIRIIDPTRWDHSVRVIASIHLLRMESHRKLLLEATLNWDLVIVDEAHHLGAVEYSSKVDKNFNYQLLEKLRERSNFFLFLSATPHQGDDDRFAHMLRLLEPEMVKGKKDLDELGERINELVGRNMKKHVTDFNGKKIFKDHETLTHQIEATDRYLTFLDALKKFVRTGMRSVECSDSRSKARANFVLYAFLKIAASSPDAIRTTLSKRYWAITSDLISNKEEKGESDGRFEGEHEEEAAKGTVEIYQGEAADLDRLIQLLDGIVDPKLHELDSIIEQEGLLKKEDLKLLIFTEYRGTQDMLQRHLSQIFGSSKVSIMNGSHSITEKRAVIREFERSSKVLISTEAGGEGLDLQRRCHLMVNYDIPWNPMRLHQRTGRLDRYGQTEKVRVHNIVVRGTVDDRVMNYLDLKIDKIQMRMGGLQGDDARYLKEEILGNTRLTKDGVAELYLDDDAESCRKIERDLQDAVEVYVRQKDIFAQIKGFDTNELEKLESKYSFKDLREIINEFLQFEHHRLVDEEDGCVHFEVPESIKAMKTYHGQRLRLARVRGTFDRALAMDKGVEMMGLGNPYIDAMMDRMIRSTHFCDSMVVRFTQDLAKDLNLKRGLVVAYLISSSPIRGGAQSFDGVEFVAYDVVNEELFDDARLKPVIDALIAGHDVTPVGPDILPEDIDVYARTLDLAVSSRVRDGRIGSSQISAVVWYEVERT